MFLPLRLIALVLVAVLPSTRAQFQGNTLFHITNQATISCTKPGYKCGYNDYDYESYQVTGTGQETVGGYGGIQNLVWSPIDVSTDFLNFTTCVNDYCLVVCNVGCDCITETGAACDTGTFAPTMAPTSNTAPQVCPHIMNTEFCAELNANLQPGNLDSFDCFNFCGGAEVGTCSFDGTCGVLTCSNATDGGATGLVQGCTKDLLLGQSSGTGSSSARQMMGKQSWMVVAVLMAVTGTWWVVAVV